MPHVRNRRTLPHLEALEDRSVPSLLLNKGPWSPDRYAPAGFTPGQTGGGRVGVLDEFISANDKDGSRPPIYNSGFYDFQGRALGLDAGTTYLAADLYVPASWSTLTQQDPSGNPASWGSLASLWATGVDASGNVSDYPIIGFNNQAGSGAGGFRVFDETNGWTNVAGFTSADQWYQIGFGIRAGGIDYFVNGQLVYADTTATGTTTLSSVMLEAYNGGNDYHIFWDDLRDTKATVADAVGANVSATEGSAFTGVVATFTDPDGSAPMGNYTATITWGDHDAGGHPLTSPGAIVDLGGGHFQVTGSHTYAEQGNYPLSVSITAAASSPADTGMAIGSSAVLSLADAAGSWYPDRYAPSGFTSSQTGGGRDGVLDEFISAGDQDGSRPAPYNSGFYDFQGRKYDLAAGSTYIAVDLYVPASWSTLNQKDPSGNPANWGSLASLWATGVDASGSTASYPIIGFNNQAGSGAGGFQVFDQTNGWTNVAGFTRADQWYQIGIAVDGNQIDYFVNGKLVYTDTTPTGAVSLSNVMLQGYNGGNDYHIFWDNLSDTKATVADAALNAGQLTPPSATEGVSTGDVVLFHFSEANPNATAADYTATVVWGDGSTNTSPDASATVSVVANGGGGFDVVGSHTYLEDLTNRTFSVSVSDASGATTSASDTAFNVADAALTAGALTPPASPTLGTPVSHQVLFHFTDADPNATAGDYTATVTWGDGSVETNIAHPADAQVVADGDGFDVIGSHTYTAGASGLTFQVSVADHGIAPVGGSATIDVSTDVVVYGTAGGDNLVVERTPGAGTGSITYILNGGSPVTLTNATSFTFVGRSGPSTLTVRFANGDPLVPGVIRFDGGAGSNTLVVDAADLAARTTPGEITVFGSPGQNINYVNVQATQLTNMMAVHASYGPDTADRSTALAGLTGNARFVQTLYLDDLGRAGDTTSLHDAGYWIAALNSGALSQAAVVLGIASSFEAEDHLVQTWYRTYLGRQPHGGEELGWVTLLQQGQTAEQVLRGVLGSDEFFHRAQTLVGSGTADERYVQGLYQQLLNRSGTGAEVAYWVNRLPQLGRQGVAQGVLGATEFRADQFEGYYNALLHRPAAQGGLNGWVFSNLDINTVRLGFEASTEFFTNG
jgi:hypothetical protein